MKLRLYLGSQQALIVQQYQSIALIVSQAFGSKKDKKVVKPQNMAEMTAAFGSVFG